MATEAVGERERNEATDPSIASRPAAGRLGRWLATGDGRAVVVLVVVPLVVFAVPALLGHPAVAGDNAIQNFPLRVLVGRQLAHGHLPLWNPYIWSGSPLLGGLNAGAAYPLTALFAFGAPIVAWTANLMAVYWAGGLGMYALLRQYRLAPLAAALAGLTYAFGGAMAAQMVHLGVVQGMGWMPWLCLALVRLSWVVLGTGPVPEGTAEVADPAGARRGSPWPWVVLTAVVVGLVILTGEPRSMAEAEVVAAWVVGWMVLRPYAGIAVGTARRLAFLGLAAAGGLWGVLLAAVQILPGWAFISASQRAVENYTFFGAGSLRPSWTVLMLVPDLFGGDGVLHQPPFFNSYNLPEVTGYVGLLPLVGFVALALRSFGPNRARRSSDWGVWLGLGVLGLLLTWGAFTPAGHLFALIPLFGKTRLQSRNLEIVDLALCVAFGFWIDRLLRWRTRARGEGDAVVTDRTDVSESERGWQRAVALLPAAAAGLVCALALAVPYFVEIHLGADPQGADAARGLWPAMAAGLLVAVAAVVVVARWDHLDRRWRARSLAAVVVADLLVFSAVTSTGLTDGYAQLEPSPALAAAVLGTNGRFAVYDTTALNVDDLSAIGQPDLNVFTSLDSVQGYGSILSEDYGTATGTHTLDTVDPCALANGVFVPLRLTTLLTLPEFLAPGLGHDGAIPAPPPTCPGAPRAGTEGRRTLFFGWGVAVTTLHLARQPGPAGSGPLRVGLLREDGSVVWPSASVRRTAAGWTVRIANPRRAWGVVVSGPAQQVATTSSFTDGSAWWALDGALQDALSQARWRFTGVWNIYARFSFSAVPPPVWLEGAAPGATVDRVSSAPWGTEVDRVATRRPAAVVRSVAYAPGWHVAARPVAGGATIDLAVHEHGLLQAVDVPRGEWQLTWLYRPATFDAGLAGSAVGLVLLCVAGVWWLVARRTRRSARERR